MNECGELAYYYNYVYHCLIYSLDIEMGTVCYAILNINNPIRYFIDVTNGKIPASLYIFQKRPRNENL